MRRVLARVGSIVHSYGQSIHPGCSWASDQRSLPNAANIISWKAFCSEAKAEEVQLISTPNENVVSGLPVERYLVYQLGMLSCFFPQAKSFVLRGIGSMKASVEFTARSRCRIFNIRYMFLRCRGHLKETVMCDNMRNMQVTNIRSPQSFLA